MGGGTACSNSYARGSGYGAYVECSGSLGSGTSVMLGTTHSLSLITGYEAGCWKLLLL